MASYSKIIQIGNIVHEPVMKYTTAGKAVVTFSLATNFKYGDKEDACFIDITFWEKAAENIVKFFKKGDPILVEGELRQERWEDKDGGKHSKHVIRGTSWGFLPGAKTGDQGQRQAPAQRQAAPAAAAPAAKPAPQGAAYGDDDIPF